MKRINGLLLFLLLLSMPWLSDAAALESVTGDQIAHSAAGGEYSMLFRLQIISQSFPKTVEFLIRCRTHQIRKEIPNFGTGAHSFRICDKTGTLIIIPYRGQPSDLNVRGEMIIWDLKEHKFMRQVTGIPFQLADLLFTPNGNKIVATSYDHISIWDIDGTHESNNLGSGDCIVLNHDGSQLLTANSYHQPLKVWDVESGQQRYQIENDNTECPFGTTIAINSDGTKVALGRYRHIFIFDAATNQTLFKIKHGYERTASLNFSADGKKLIGRLYSPPGSRSIEGRGVWSVDTGEELSHEDYGDVRGWLGGTKRVKSRLDGGILSENIFDDETGQLLWTDEGSVNMVTDHWCVAYVGGKIYAYDLDQLAAFQDDITSLSDRQLLLLNQIRYQAEHSKKFKLDRNNSKLAKVVQDYDTLPLQIKDIVQNHVIFGAYK